MIKKLLFFVIFFAAVLWADDNSDPGIKSAVIKLQTQVGETAVNNVLNAYFAGKHVIPVKDKGNITLTLNENKFGIDIQEKDNVVFGYDLTIATDFQFSLMSGERVNGKLSINGEMDVSGAISAKTVKQTIDNIVEQSKNVIVVLLDLNSIIEKILNKHGIKEVPVVSAIKDFFLKKEMLVEGKMELWRQDYSSLLNDYINKVESNFDLKIIDMDLGLAFEKDNIVVTFEVEVQSERQRFWFEGEFNDYANMTLNSNKEFQLLELDMVYDMAHGETKPKEYSLVNCKETNIRTKSVNFNEICGTPRKKVPALMGFFRLRCKYGGIISFWKRIK